jgi:hypothetical protein
MTRTVEQPGIEDSLQLLERFGYRRLGDTEAVRRTGNAAAAGHFKKAGQVAKLDSVIHR